MENPPDLVKKLRLFWELHWVKVVCGVVLLVSILLPVAVLSRIDSYQRLYIVALLSIFPLEAILSAGAFVFFLYWLHYGGGLSFSKIKKNLVRSEAINIRWTDVIGLEEAKQESREVVELLTDRARVQRIGGKVLRGLLLVGPPGCGKTYLAKAIATESGLPFISASGSEFVEMFVGVGPSRVRGLFKKARQMARIHGGSILFIDELDAAGTGRTMDLGFGGQTEHNMTVNQFLIELDGLNDQEANILVIGATNASESVLDQALLRPGRFDRKIYVDRPGLDDREKLFRYYLGKVKCDSSIDVARLARRSVWKTPADIENVVKESALIAARNKREQVAFKDLSEAIERLELGFKRLRKMNEEERRRIAYHEAGHVVVTYLLHPTDDVFKASIISRRDALGVVYHQPREDLFTSSRDRILANIKSALAGYVAEKLKCASTSTGVAADFQNAMSQAHQMVWKLGMGSNGFIGDYEILLSSWIFRGESSGDRLSDRIKEKLNDETNRILQQCLQEVEALLRQEDALLERFTKELLEKQELEYDEIEAVFVEHGKQRTLPPPATSPPT